MSTYKFFLTVAESETSKSFKTEVRESGSTEEEAIQKALEGWPIGTVITSFWRV